MSKGACLFAAVNTMGMCALSSWPMMEQTFGPSKAAKSSKCSTFIAVNHRSTFFEQASLLLLINLTGTVQSHHYFVQLLLRDKKTCCLGPRPGGTYARRDIASK